MDESALFYNAQPNTRVTIRGETYLRERPHTNTGELYYSTATMSKVKNQSPLGKFAKSRHMQNFCLHKYKF